MELLPFIEANRGVILLGLVLANAVQLVRYGDLLRRISNLENFVYPKELRKEL